MVIFFASLNVVQKGGELLFVYHKGGGVYLSRESLNDKTVPARGWSRFQLIVVVFFLFFLFFFGGGRVKPAQVIKFDLCLL